MTLEVVHAPMSWLNAVAPYVCVAGVEREKVGGEREVKGREKEKREGDGGDGREREAKRDERERDRQRERERETERDERRERERERCWYSKRENEYTVL